MPPQKSLPARFGPWATGWQPPCAVGYFLYLLCVSCILRGAHSLSGDQSARAIGKPDSLSSAVPGLYSTLGPTPSDPSGAIPATFL